MNYATYRILYGTTFIKESIRSIEPFFDKIFVFWTNKALADTTSCLYKGKEVKFPTKFDDVVEQIISLRSKKVILIEDYVYNNDNQFTHLVNDLILPRYKKPYYIMFIEPDHVFHEEQIQSAFSEFRALIKSSPIPIVHASTSYVELWKTPYYRTVEHASRYRLGSILWDMRKLDKIPPTHKHAQIPKPSIKPHFLKSYVHDLGFCVSNESMYWKHLIALGISQKIGDSVPIENWYEDVWLNWKFKENKKNLHMSIGYEHLIPNIVEYDVSKLPLQIKMKYNINT